MEDTMAYVMRRGLALGQGLNWGAATAGFVCPGAGQFMVGRKSSGMVFLVTFILACAISLVPLFICVISSTMVAMGNATTARPIPWLLVLGGLGIAILTWIVAMIQAAFLEPTNKDSEQED